MDKLYTRMKITIYALLFGSSVLLFGCVFVPLELSLKHQIENSFIEESKLHILSVRNQLNEMSAGAKSLASRTMIRQALIDYLSGETDLESLRNYTQPKYEEGAKALSHVVLAERHVGQDVIARYIGNEAADAFILKHIERHNDTSLIEETIDGWFLHTWAPISHDGKVIGEDHVVFDLASTLSMGNTERITARLMSQSQADKTFKQASLLRNEDTYRLVMSHDELIYLDNFSETASISVTGEVHDIFSYFTMVTRTILISWILTFVVVLFIIRRFILRYVEQHIGKTEVACSRYQRMAYIDGLSGAYSRHFLDVLKEDIKNSTDTYVLVMVDIDRFKHINDTYGHDEGDKVLRSIASNLIQSIRADDFVVRYGGDEFLVIFKNIARDVAELIMERAQRNMKDPLACGKISFSYGLSDVVSGDKIDAALRDADISMYIMKKTNGVARDVVYTL